LRRIGLAAAATGLPPAFLLDPARAAAEPGVTRPTFVLLTVSDAGDPFNVNAPGSYVEGVFNNPVLAVSEVELGARVVACAAPWADPSMARMLRRTAFIHHATFAVAHSEMSDVLTLRGALTGQGLSDDEELPSMLAQELAPSLGTLTGAPISLAGAQLTSRGVSLPLTTPQQVAALYSGRDEGGDGLSLDRLATLRDQTLNRLYRQPGFGPAQRQFIDRYLTSREQATAAGEALAEGFAGLAEPGSPEADGVSDQFAVALALFRFQIAPVVVIRIPFGGDNHGDDQLIYEADQTQQGVALIADLDARLHAGADPLVDRVTFANLNVFGRTLYGDASGRDHNATHHVMMLSGPGVAPSVIGGIGEGDEGIGALPIDRRSGQGLATGGDISVSESLVAAGRTLARAAGIPDTRLDQRFRFGRAIDAALVG
jgi:hypothetical protein